MAFSEIAKSTNAGITDARGFVDNKAEAFVSPRAAEGISGWLFDIPEEENLSLSSDITDHFTEDNRYINDHIVRKPIRITLRGFLGEKVFQRSAGFEGALQELDNRLEVVDGYLGNFTDGMTQKLQGVVSQTERVVSGVNRTLDRVQNVVGFFEGEDQAASRQQQLYQELKALWNSSQLLTVQTPWDYLEDMLIETIDITQGAESQDWSEVTVTLKQVRFADVQTTDFDETLFPVRENAQSDPEQDIGNVRGERNSFLFEGARAGGIIDG